MAEAFGVTFGRGVFLWLLAAAPLALLLLVLRERTRTRLAQRFVSERLRGVANTLRPWRPWLLALAIAASALAMAAPRRGYTVVPVETHESNRVIAIDVSLSMAANDVGVARLDAAKAIAKRIVESHAGRIGLIVFEQSPEVVSPLTSDDEAVDALIDSIQPGEVDLPGTDLAAALAGAQKLLDADPKQSGDIIVISDGEDQGGSVGEAERKLRARGIAVSTIVVGTTRGSTIPSPNTSGPLRDDNGEIVVTYAHPETLQALAHATGGRFFENPFAEHALDSLAATGGDAREKNIRIPIERYQWPLGVAFVLLMLGSAVNRGAE